MNTFGQQVKDYCTVLGAITLGAAIGYTAYTSVIKPIVKLVRNKINEKKGEAA
jgi:hypothetical protein